MNFLLFIKTIVMSQVLHLVPLNFFSDLADRLINLAEKAKQLAIPSLKPVVNDTKPVSSSPEAYFKSTEDMEVDFSYTLHTERCASHNYPEAHEIYYALVRSAEINGVVSPELMASLMEENY